MDVYSKKLYIAINAANANDTFRKYFNETLPLFLKRFHIMKGKIT